LLVFDPVNGANLRDGATDDQYLVHDKWFDSSCLHEGYAAVEWLGNMSSIAEIREILKRRKSGEDDFQVLLGKVVYSGTHCGDHLPIAGVLRLQQEIGKAKGIQLPDGNSRMNFQQFVRSIETLCKTSIETGNPIVF
jgi:hypothetical protein